jgi:hypothetical protein
MEGPYLRFARLLPEGMRTLAHVGANGWIIPAASIHLMMWTGFMWLRVETTCRLMEMR